MDSLSQFVLGAAVGGAVVGHRAGGKALAWGGVIATLPDLDVLIPLADPVSRFTWHRSASHSILVLTLLAPLLAWMLTRCHEEERSRYFVWLLAVWLILITHVVLDALTVYGTQLLWPVWPEPISWGTIFIIDPAYTLPLAIAVLGAALVRASPARLRSRAVAGLLISTSYLTLGGVLKLHVEQQIRGQLAARGIVHERLMTTPTAFNIVLWRGVAMTTDGYYEIFHSLFDNDDISLRYFSNKPHLLRDIEESWAVRRLQWFTRGFYRVRNENGEVVMTDLRMGQEPYYSFSFVVGEQTTDGTVAAVPNRRAASAEMSAEMLSAIGCRIGSGVAADC